MARASDLLLKKGELLVAEIMRKIVLTYKRDEVWECIVGSDTGSLYKGSCGNTRKISSPREISTDKHCVVPQQKNTSTLRAVTLEATVTSNHGFASPKSKSRSENRDKSLTVNEILNFSVCGRIHFLRKFTYNLNVCASSQAPPSHFSLTCRKVNTRRFVRYLFEDLWRK